MLPQWHCWPLLEISLPLADLTKSAYRKGGGERGTILINGVRGRSEGEEWRGRSEGVEGDEWRERSGRSGVERGVKGAEKWSGEKSEGRGKVEWREE